MTPSEIAEKLREYADWIENNGRIPPGANLTATGEFSEVFRRTVGECLSYLRSGRISCESRVLIELPLMVGDSGKMEIATIPS